MIRVDKRKPPEFKRGKYGKREHLYREVVDAKPGEWICLQGFTEQRVLDSVRAGMYKQKVLREHLEENGYSIETHQHGMELWVRKL
jgi:hypothetical protein